MRGFRSDRFGIRFAGAPAKAASDPKGPKIEHPPVSTVFIGQVATLRAKMVDPDGIFEPKLWRRERPLRVVMVGTDFEVRVWEALLKVPMGRVTTYSDIAARVCTPKAARAVGAAVGKNPISFVVPCHRVIGKGGDLTGYHWGLTRKRAMLGWEAGQAGAGAAQAG